MLTALDKVNGDLSDGQKKFREALASLEFDTPTGKVKLDKNRNAIADIFLTEVAEGADGNLYNKVVKVIPQVNQTPGHAGGRVPGPGVGQPRQPAMPVAAAADYDPDARSMADALSARAGRRAPTPSRSRA